MTSLVEGNAAVRFLDSCLRGAGQVIFQDNPLSGLFFLAAIAWGGVAGGSSPEVAVGAVLGVAAASLTAMVLRADRGALRQGLFGFNGFLVGAAVPTFLAATPAMWLLVIAGAALSAVAMLAVSRLMRRWGLPALTAPFVLTTWLLLLAARVLGAEDASAAAGATSGVPLLEGWLDGPAQVIFVDNWLSGVLVVLGLAVSSLPAAGFALMGSGVALAVAPALGASFAEVSNGLWGFSPVLTAVALGCAFRPPSWRTGLAALAAVAVTVVVQAALAAGLATADLPVLTAPFVLVTWLFLLPRTGLRPA